MAGRYTGTVRDKEYDAGNAARRLQRIALVLATSVWAAAFLRRP